MKALEKKQNFVVLRAQGKTYADISTSLGVCRQTLINWSRELQTEIANHRAIEIESVVKTLELTRELRLKAISDALAKIKAELAKRDFSDMPTEKLLEQLLRLNAAATKQFDDVTFRVIEKKSSLDQPIDSFFETVDEKWTG